jgi:hypothetical protein
MTGRFPRTKGLQDPENTPQLRLAQQKPWPPSRVERGPMARGRAAIGFLSTSTATEQQCCKAPRIHARKSIETCSQPTSRSMLCNLQAGTQQSHAGDSESIQKTVEAWNRPISPEGIILEESSHPAVRFRINSHCSGWVQPFPLAWAESRRKDWKVSRGNIFQIK